MNDPIKNLSGQENLIELYRLERCFVRGTAQMLTIYADLRQTVLQRIATELGRGITSGRPLARNYP